MSERSIEEMMDILDIEQNYNFDEKRGEIIERTQNDFFKMFLRTLAAVGMSRRKGEITKPQAELYQEKIDKIAHEKMSEYWNAYLYLKNALKIGNENYNGNFQFRNLPEVYQSYLDGDFILPDLKQMQIAFANGYSNFFLVPGQASLEEMDNGLKFEIMQDSIFLNSEIKLENIVSDARPNSYYVLAIKHARDAMESFDESFKSDDDETLYFEAIDKKLKKFKPPVSENMHLGGLTLSEYFAAQISTCTKNKLLSQTSQVRLLDQQQSANYYSRSVLLGSRYRDESQRDHFISTRLSNKLLTITCNDDRNLKYHPWVALSFNPIEELEDKDV